MSVTVYVTYPGGSSDKFDRDYWLTEHFDLVRKTWGPYGMQTIAGFFPEGDGGGTVAIAPVVFRDEAAMKQAFAAPETARVMDDIQNFTDIQPVRYRAAEL